MRRSACVPLPTPGAPTSMIRAARLNSFVAIEPNRDVSGAESGVLRACGGGRGKKAGAARSSKKLKASAVRDYSLMLTDEKYVQLYRQEMEVVVVPGVELWGGGPLLSGNFGIGCPLSPSPRLSVTDSISRSYNDLVVVLANSAGGQ